jgi:hypothetical protein
LGRPRSNTIARPCALSNNNKPFNIELGQSIPAPSASSSSQTQQAKINSSLENRSAPSASLNLGIGPSATRTQCYFDKSAKCTSSSCCSVDNRPCNADRSYFDHVYTQDNFKHPQYQPRVGSDKVLKYDGSSFSSSSSSLESAFSEPLYSSKSRTNSESSSSASQKK